MKKIIESDIQCYLDNKSISINFKVDYSNLKDFQYQSAVIFSLKNNKNFDKNDFIKFLINTNHYKNVEITGAGFVSFAVKFENFNFIKNNIKKKVIVDYCGVNVAKKMHIGHIRSMFTGDFIVRLNEYLGNEVIIYNHIGDWGNQFGFLINYIIKNNLNPTNNEELTNWYKASYTLYKEDVLFKEESDIVAFDLQNFKNEEIHYLWKKCVDISLKDLEHFLNIFDLKINNSHVKGESFYAQFCNETINDLLKKGIAFEDFDKSIFVDINGSKTILKKSNGNYLYILYDLAAIKWRVDNHAPDEIIYVVDKRQSLHFENLFSIANLAGYSKCSKLIHLGFGTITDNNGKPLKTKEGESLYLNDLLNDGKSIILNNQHTGKLPLNKKEEIINKTLIGGLKFFDLKFVKHNDYSFNWDHIFNFSGNSAPYIQNAYVRVDSILFKKFENNVENLNLSMSTLDDSELTILFNIFKTYEIIFDSVNGYQSNILANQLVYLCSIFHAYYEKTKIINSVNELNKLALLKILNECIKTSLNILGVDVYDCLKDSDF